MTTQSEPPPYTGHTSSPNAPAPTVIWHSRVALIGTGAAAVLAAALTGIGSANFPDGAPVEQLYCFGLIVDLVAVAITLGALTAAEYTRRGVPGRLTQPVNTRRSVFAMIALGLSVVAFIAWATGGGVEQLGYLLSGIRPRYMYSTGTLFVAGIPWALGAIFGVVGFRPGGNRLTNVFALAAIGLWLVLAILSTMAALVYGADLSD